MRPHLDLVRLTAILLGLAAFGVAGVSHAQEQIEAPDPTPRGLERAWRTQVDLDPSRHELTGAQLSGDTIYAVTSAGLVQAIDAESGASLWRVRLGKPGRPTFGPSAHKGHLAVINGATLFVLDGATGSVLDRREVPGAPGSSPVLSDDYCFIPLVSGRMIAFPTDPDRAIPWRRASSGRVFDPPILIGDLVLWTDDDGALFAARADGGGVEYEFKAPSRLVAPAASHGDLVYLPSVHGQLYALDSKHGTRRWRESIGSEVRQPAAAVAGAVYVSTMEPALYAFDAGSGRPLWSVPGADRFVSRSADRVYAVDPSGCLLSIDAESGRVMEESMVARTDSPIVNQQSDRLYFSSPDGLLVCLHEPDLSEPIVHHAVPTADEPSQEPQPEPPVEQPAVAEEPVVEEPEPESDPFEEEGSDPFDF